MLRSTPALALAVTRRALAVRVVPPEAGRTVVGRHDSVSSAAVKENVDMDEHSVGLRRARMVALRGMLEERDVEPEPAPFNGYFKQFEEELLGPKNTADDIARFLEELEAMPPFPDAEDPEAGLKYDPRGTMEGIRVERSQPLAHRAEGVGDELERQLLLALAYHTLNHRLTDAAIHEDPVGKPSSNPTLTPANDGYTRGKLRFHPPASPQLYMKYGADNRGTDYAFYLLEAANYRPVTSQHPEVLRYHAELALSTGQFERLRTTLQMAVGPPDSHFAACGLEPPSAALRAARRETGEAVVLQACCDLLFRTAMAHSIDGTGEGGAATSVLENIRPMCHILGKDRICGLIVRMAEEADSMLMAAEQDKGQMDDKALSPMERRDASHRCGMLASGAIAALKTLVTTELPLVVDPSGSLHFDVLTKLYIGLRTNERIHESWGIAEHSIEFYREYRDRLVQRTQELIEKAEPIPGLSGAAEAAAYDEPARDARFIEPGPAAVAEAAAVDRSAVPVSTTEDPNSLESDTYEQNGAQERLTGGDVYGPERPPSAEGWHPDEGYPFEHVFRLMFFQYITDRAKENPSQGLPLIERACQQYPNSCQVWRILALTNLKLHRATEARIAARRATELNPADPQGHLLLSQAFTQEKNHLGAARSRRVGHLVNDLVFSGVEVTNADMEAVRIAMRDLDSRRAAAEREALASIPDDGWSHGFNQRERRLQVQDAIVPAVQDATALMTGAAAAIVRELSSVEEVDVDEELREWMAQMKRHHRYSKFVYLPRTDEAAPPRDHLESLHSKSHVMFTDGYADYDVTDGQPAELRVRYQDSTQPRSLEEINADEESFRYAELGVPDTREAPEMRGPWT